MPQPRFPVEPLKTLTIVAVTVIVYWPVMQAGFIWNDTDLTDGVMLQENGLHRVWFTTEASNYWPVTWTSYWIEYQAWGLHPLGYHVVNVALHALACLLIWRGLLQLGVPAAWGAALLFAVHPVNVESVAWITQRKNVLCLLFFAASVCLFLTWTGNGRRRVFLLSLLSFLLAMLSKGAAVGLPVVLLMCLWWRNGTLTRKDLLCVLPFFLIAGGMGLVEIWFQYVRSIGDESVRDDSLLARLTGAGRVVWFYLAKAVWPRNLTFVYPRWQIDAADWTHHLPNLALLATFVAAWQRRNGWGRPVLFALGYYVVMLAPVLGFFNIYFMKYSFVADHYQYLALIGIVGLFVGVLWSSFPRTPFGRWLASGLILTVMLGCSALTWQQARLYVDSETVWRDTLRKNPDSSLAHYNLGVLLFKRGDTEAARRHFLEAIQADPREAWALANLGTIFEAEGRENLAIEYYRRALELDPRIPAAHSNWADILQRRGEYHEAIDHYRAAIAIDPQFAGAHNNLGSVLHRLGRVEEAADHYRQALEAEPDNWPAQQNLRRALDELTRRNEDRPAERSPE